MEKKKTLFDHTPGPWYDVDFAGYITMQNGPNYTDNDLLDMEAVGEIKARYNGILMSKAPELLNRLIHHAAETGNKDDLTLIAECIGLKKINKTYALRLKNDMD